MEMPVVSVAVAVIKDAQNRLLITRRAPDTSHGGFWEFPGGKLEPGEQGADALIREVKEEVGLEVLAYNYLGEVSHRYPHRHVLLLVYHVHAYHGDAHCKEGQMDLRWVKQEALSEFQFPAANLDIIKLIT